MLDHRGIKIEEDPSAISHPIGRGSAQAKRYRASVQGIEVRGTLEKIKLKLNVLLGVESDDE